MSATTTETTGCGGGKYSTDRACTKSELELFEPVDVQVALTDGRWLTYQPLNPIGGADVIEYVIPGTANEGLDLNNISIYIAGRIKDGTNANIAAAGADAHFSTAPVNNFLGSLFRHVDVSINGQLLTRASREYAYKDYLLKTLYYQMPAGGKERTQAECFGYYPDQAGHANGFSTGTTINTGAQKRAKWIDGSKRFELRGPVSLDLFSSDRLLFPGTDVHIKFHLNDPKFFLMDATATTQRTLHLEEAVLYVRRVTISDTFVNQLQASIKSHDAIYPFIRREIATFNVATGMSSIIKENLFRGQLATRYFIAMVNQNAFNGTAINQNPYHFQNFNINEIALFENGQCIAGQPLKMDFGENAHDTLNAYYMLLETIGGVGERALYPPITYKEFKSHNTIFAFTRSPDLSHGEVALPTQVGNVSLRLNFGAALTDAITVIVMAEFDSRIQINQYKNVVTDYAV